MKDYLIWVFTRWYFWLIVVVNFFINAPKELVRFSEYVGAFLGSILIIFIFFSIGRFIFWIIGKARGNK